MTKKGTSVKLTYAVAGKTSHKNSIIVSIGLSGNTRETVEQVACCGSFCQTLLLVLVLAGQTSVRELAVRWTRPALSFFFLISPHGSGADSGVLRLQLRPVDNEEIQAS